MIAAAAAYGIERHAMTSTDRDPNTPLSDEQLASLQRRLAGFVEVDTQDDDADGLVGVEDQADEPSAP